MVAVHANPFRCIRVHPSKIPGNWLRSSSRSRKKVKPKTEWKDWKEELREKYEDTKMYPGTIAFKRRVHFPAKPLRIGSLPSSLRNVITVKKHRRGRSGRDHGRAKIQLARLKVALREAVLTAKLRARRLARHSKLSQSTVSSFSSFSSAGCAWSPTFPADELVLKPFKKNGGSNGIARKKHGSGARTHARRMRRAQQLAMEELAINGPSLRDIDHNAQTP